MFPPGPTRNPCRGTPPLRSRVDPAGSTRPTRPGRVLSRRNVGPPAPRIGRARTRRVGETWVAPDRRRYAHGVLSGARASRQGSAASQPRPGARRVADRLAIDVTRELLDDLALAVYEAIANMTEHAYPDHADGHGPVRLAAHRSHDGVLITIADEGSLAHPDRKSLPRRACG